MYIRVSSSPRSLDTHIAKLKQSLHDLRAERNALNAMRRTPDQEAYLADLKLTVESVRTELRESEEVLARRSEVTESRGVHPAKLLKKS